MADKITKENREWMKKQEALMEEGTQIVKSASDEALDYLSDAIENMNDGAWRRMTISTQAVEIGIGVAFSENLMPNIYEDMKKSLHRKLKLDKEKARALRHIYIGRVIKNIKEKLDERNQ